MAKRRWIGILNAKNKKQRKPKYKDLLKVTGKVLSYADNAVQALDNRAAHDLTAIALSCQIKTYAELTLKL